MADKTKIEWTDATWNPVTGCTKVTAGCDNCYAESIAHRFAGTPAYPDGFKVTLRRERLDQPLRWRRPRRVFVNSMSDLFHADVPTDFIADVFGVMAANFEHDQPTHTFQVLTKRYARMRSLLNDPGFRANVALSAAQYTDEAHADAVHDAVLYHRWPVPNVWVGVAVEDQKTADMRIPALLDTPAAVRFLSCEPLLGPVDLNPWLEGCTCETRVVDYSDPERHHHENLDREDTPGCPEHDGIGWVIVGGESGPRARPMRPEWARSLRDQCDDAGVPFHFKQWGTHDENGARVGKKTAGRVLDGVTRDGFPC